MNANPSSTASDFPQFPDPNVKSNLKTLVDQMAKLKQEIERFNEQLDTSRNQFKESINSLFRTKAPLPTQTLEEDLEQFVYLVSYCLEVGDVELLEEWAIQPIRQNSSTALASQEFETYKEACALYLEQATRELQEDCWRKLVEVFIPLTSSDKPVAVASATRNSLNQE